MKRSDFLRTAGLGSISFPIFQESKQKQDERPIVKPARLQPGDTIGLTAPAGIVFEESEFDKMTDVLESMGFHVRFGEYVKERHGYFSGTDRQRAADLNRFFADPEVDAIMAVRGGWGCARILPYLDFDIIRANPKIYCGFSDNTTLHLAIKKECGLVTFHGPNGASDWTGLTKENFRSVLIEGEKTVFQSKGPVRTIFPGEAEGVLLGGNLTILTTSLGTDYQPNTNGAILFVEDIGEQVYKIDRMLTHLKLAGLLEGLSGFVFGRCTDCTATGSPDNFSLTEILRQHLEPLGIPAIYGADISHEPDNFTIPYGINARLNANHGIFELSEPAVH